MTDYFRQLLAVQLQVLTFRKPAVPLAEQWPRFLPYVFVVTWIVGMGRYWDGPNAHLFQKLGLGSLIYIVVMSAVLWLCIAPIAVHRVSYGLVLTFVGLTSAPAILYAIPVELFLPPAAAAEMNLLFLSVVAIWRVSLLVNFCDKAAGLPAWGTLTATLLPLTGIMILLASFSLEHVTFEIMGAGGWVEDETHSRTKAGLIASGVTQAAGWSYSTVSWLAALSWLLFPALLVSYIVLLYRKQRERGVGT